MAREAYDRVRNETDSKCKKELETTITDLKVGRVAYCLFFIFSQLSL